MANSKPKFTQEQLKWLRDFLAITPCHVTGMHDPNHTGSCICSEQQAAAWHRLMAALGFSPAKPRRRLHHKNCYFCHKGKGKEAFARWVAKNPLRIVDADDWGI